MQSDEFVLQFEDSKAAEAILDAVLGDVTYVSEELIEGTEAYVWASLDIPGINQYKIQQVYEHHLECFSLELQRDHLTSDLY